jgi:hypothetical protein
MQRRRAVKATLAIGLALAALAGSLAWGILIGRDHVFPYGIVRGVYQLVVPRRVGPHRWSPPGGRPPASGALSTQRIDQLANLPYLQGYRPATAGGVLSLDRTLAQDGVNFFTSGHAPTATLMDMDGRVLKSWNADPRRAFPSVSLTGLTGEYASFLRCARLLPDGGIVAVFDQLGVVRLDADSRLVWTFPSVAHHDLFIEPTGRVFVLTRENHIVPSVRPTEPVWEDFVTELSPEGHILRKISILQAFQRSTYAPLLTRMPSGADLFHTNSLEVFDGSLAARWPLLRKGNILLSVHHLDALAILDPDSGRIVWALTGQWHAQHCARLLSGSRLLLFDNFGTMQESSRVLEVDPFSQEIVWQFGGVPEEALFSETAGFEQRLPNGNTLVSESNFGRAVEVTPDHRIAWEFVNPNRAGKNHELVATLYMVQRLPRDLSLLTRPESVEPGTRRASARGAGETSGAAN